jgi:hypothetical protein
LACVFASAVSSSRNAAILGAAVAVDERQRPGLRVACGVAQDAHERRDADAARDEDRGARAVAMQRERAERPLDPHGGADRQGRERVLVLARAHARGDREIGLERRAHQRERVALAAQDEIDRLPRLEVESGRLLEMERHRAFRDRLAPQQPRLPDLRGHVVHSDFRYSTRSAAWAALRPSDFFVL